MRKLLPYVVMTLCLGLLCFYQAFSQCTTPDVTKPADQILCNGSTTTAISFSGSVPGTVFQWTNDKPSIGLAANGTGNIASFSATNTTSAPISATVTVTPYASKKPVAYIPNVSSNNVSVVDVNSGTVVGSAIAVGSSPYAVATSPDGTKVYVGNLSSKNISVISTATNTVVATIPLPGGPLGIVLSADGSRAYTANFGSDNVSVINTVTNTVIGSPIPVGVQPSGITISPDGSRVYVTNRGSSDNSVSVINTATNTVIGSPIPVGNNPYGLTITPDGSQVYVANSGSNFVSVINTATNSVTSVATPSGATGIAVTPDGTKVYAHHSANVSVISTSTNTVIGSPIAVGNGQGGVSFTSDGSIAYVASSSSNKVYVINTATNTVTGSPIIVGTSPNSFGNAITDVPACPGTPETFTITVHPNTAITTQPTAKTVCEGSSATFSVAASGLSLTYQWRKDGVDISGANSDSYTIPAAAATDAGMYDVVVTGTCATATSTAVKLTVNTSPSITTPPTDQTVCPSSSVSFTVSATGGGLSYLWLKEGAAISGATSSSYTISSVSAGDAANYSVEVSNGCGTVTSGSATLSVNVSTKITTQPVAKTVCATGSATFSVTATGSNLTYQWYKDGSPILSATSSTLSLSGVTTANAGNYSVDVSGDCGNETSSSVALTVLPITAITTDPVSKAVCEGGSVTFSGSAAGTGIVYKWQKDGSDISGTSTNSYTLSTVTTADAGSYTLVATSACGVATSNAAILTVNAIPAMPTIGSSSATTFCVGGSVTLTSSAASGNQWYKDGAILIGETGQAYTTNVSGNFTVEVKQSGCTSPPSTATTVTVNVMPTAPTISNASSTTFCAGGNVVLTSSATSGNQWYKDGALISGATAQTYTATTSGSYTIKATSGSCTSSASAGTVVTVNATPATPVITATGNILSSSAASGNQWYLNGTAIIGAANQTYRVQASGLYKVQVTSGACSSTSADYNFVATRIDNPGTWNSEVTLHPNPVAKSLTISNVGSRKLQVHIYDGFGREVHASKLMAAQGTIDVQGFSAGVYHVVITDLASQKSITQTIVKQ